MALVARWLLGADRPADLAHVVALFAFYLAFDRLTRLAAQVSADDVQHPVLVLQSILHHPVAWLVLMAGAAGAVVWRPARVWAPWRAFEHGTVLRRLAAVPLFLTAYLSSAYHYNFLASQWHPSDRLLAIGLALAALARPAFLIPVAIEARVINRQFVVPFGTEAGPNIDAVLVTILVGVAALHALHVVTGSRRTGSIVLFSSTVLAAHFFVPGATKVSLGWLGANHLWNLPLSAFTAGWLGSTSGTWARVLARLAEPLNLPIQVGTLLLELGAAIAVAHYRLLRWWLMPAIAFHIGVFALTGFWFLVWIALEVTLVVAVSLPALRSWVAENATPARGLAAAGIVMFAGARLYQPPTLAWFDGPVSYGYQLEGVGASGTAYHVPFTVAAPFEQELNFLRLSLAATREATSAYGAVGTRTTFESLNGIDSWDALRTYEQGLTPPSPTDVEVSERFVAQVLEHINRDGRAPWLLRPLPTHFWTSRPPPLYSYQEPLSRLEVVRVTALHRRGEPIFRRESLVTVEATGGGAVRVTARGAR